MSILHEKLKAIIAAIDSAFDFANPELVREKAETEFKQAVADEYKALTERVEALEKLAQPVPSSTLTMLPGGVTHLANPDVAAAADQREVTAPSVSPIVITDVATDTASPTAGEDAPPAPPTATAE